MVSHQGLAECAHIGFYAGAHLKLTVLPLFAQPEMLNIHMQIVKVPSGGEKRRAGVETA